MPSTATDTIVLPGDVIPPSMLPLPASSTGSLKLGPGLTHQPPSTICSNTVGTLHVDPKKHAIWVENNTGRYLPQPQDLVLATVHHSSTDYFHCNLTPHTAQAVLPHLAFENVSRKSRPQLMPGALVYARITSSLAHNKFQDPEIACVNLSTGKSEGLGELKGGMLFDISLSMARRLLASKPKAATKGIVGSGDIAVLELLAKKMTFEVAVGRNGRIWVDAGGVKSTLLIGRALQETDEGGLDRAAQEKLVKRLSKEVGLDT